MDDANGDAQLQAGGNTEMESKPCVQTT